MYSCKFYNFTTYSFPTKKMSFKVESGIQLLTRLTRKPNIENFYPRLFPSGPKQSEIIELISENNVINLLIDIICEALLFRSGSVEAGVLIFNCDGNFDYEALLSCMQKKIVKLYNNSDNANELYDKEKLNSQLKKTLSNLFILTIYDATQLYTSIYNLESILIDHPNIALIVFDTISAFYWSEQSFKLMKIDTYIKSLLQIVQKVTKEHKVTIIYTRPKYFSSTKDILENLEMCSESPCIDRINSRIQIICNQDGTYEANIMTFNKKIRHNFTLIGNSVQWTN